MNAALGRRGAVKFGVLGPYLIYPGQPHRVRAAKHRALLAILTVNANKFVPVHRLAAELWGGEPPMSAANLLRQYVSYLRRELPDSAGTNLIKTMSGGYLMPLRPGDVDKDEFDRLSQLGRDELSRDRLEAGIEALSAALDLWRGQALVDIEQSPSIVAESRRLEERRLALTETRLNAVLRGGHYASVIDESIGLVALHPERERLQGLLMRALHATGRRAEALAAYQEARKALVDGMGVEPGPELQGLHRQILREKLPEEPRPVRSRSRPITAVPGGQLPVDVPDLVGRDPELIAVRKELRPVGPRAAASPPVVIVSGKVGVGKSVLAVRVGHLIRSDFPDGQLFVSLADGECPPATALGRVLGSLGMSTQEQSAQFEDLVELFRALTLDRKLLLMLDDAAAEQQVRPLIPPSSESAVIVTSRRTLAGIEGARHVVCTPLNETESVRMLTSILGEERVHAEPEAVRRLAARCGRLPLALRTVGSLLVQRRHWSLEFALRRFTERNLLDELCAADLAVRPRLAASYACLSPVAQQVFRGIGNLPGGDFDLALLAKSAGVQPALAESAIDQLIDMHLVDVAGAAGNSPPGYTVDDLVLAFASECEQSAE